MLFTFIKQNGFRETSYFRPFLTKLFHSDAVMSSADVCVNKINCQTHEVKTKHVQCVSVSVSEKHKPTRSCCSLSRMLFSCSNGEVA